MYSEGLPPMPASALNAASRILSTLLSEMPLTRPSSFRVAYATASTVCSPLSFSFLRSPAEMPLPSRLSIICQAPATSAASTIG